MVLDDATRWDLIHQKTYREGEAASLYAEEVEKFFPRNSLITELGTGTGADAFYFLQKGHSVIALDISSFALKILEERARKEGFTQKLATRQVDFGLHKLPIKDDSCDIAYSRISLNYFGADDTAKIFSDIYRILKKGGKAFLTLKSPDDVNEMIYLKNNASVYEENVFIEGGVLRSRFSVEQLREILTNAKIPQFNIRPIREDLSKKGENHNPYLFLNEVTFTKL